MNSKNVHQTDCLRPQPPKLRPATAHYKSTAAIVERNSHNNNIFNGRNISDNTPATFYYQVKAQPHLKNAEVRVATQGRRL